MGNGGKIPRVEPGKPILTRSINGIVNAVNRLRMMQVTPPLSLSDGPIGPVLRNDLYGGFWARLTGHSGNAYSYQEVTWQGGTTVDVTGGRTGTTSTRPAYEVNGITTLATGWVDYLRPGAPGEYVFQSVKYGTCTGTVTVNVKCNSTNISGATVTISQGGTTYATGTTNGSGNFSTTALPSAGTYDVAVSKTGFASYTGTFSYSCSSITVNVTIASTSNVITGTISGCGSVLSGVLVTADQGGPSLGTATTDGSGNFSLTLSSWSGGSVNLTGAKLRYANLTGITTPSACAITSSSGSRTMTPSSAYTCHPGCFPGLPVDKNTTCTFDGQTVTMTYSSIRNGWVGTVTLTKKVVVDTIFTKSVTTITVELFVGAGTGGCGIDVNYNSYNSTFSQPISDAFFALGGGPGGSLVRNYQSTGYSTTTSPIAATFTGNLFVDADGTNQVSTATWQE